MLGLTTNGIGSATSILLNNGGIFAFGGPLTTSTLVSGNNSTAVIGGTNSITLNNVSKGTGNNLWRISNNLENGAILTINNGFGNLEAGSGAATQTIELRGYGSTVINGNMTENAAVGGKLAWNIAIHQDATFTTSGAANTYTGGTTLTDGILILDKATTPLGTGTFTLSGGTLRQGPSVSGLTLSNNVVIGGSPARLDGNKSWTFGGTFAMGASRNLQNDLTGGATLTINGAITNTAASTFTLFGTGNTILAGGYAAGTGANALQQAGTGTVTLSGAGAATGALTVSRGTVLINGASGSWNAGTTNITSGGTLTLDNSASNNASGRLFDTGAVTGNGGTLNMISNASNSTELAGALTLNNANTTINLSGAGTNTLTFASIVHTNAGGVIDLTGTTSLGVNNKLIFTAAPTLTNGINTRFLLGSDFARHTANGVEAFIAYNASNNLNTAAVTDTMDITASASVNATRTVNALKINGSGLNVSSSVTNGRLALFAGGLLNTGGNNTISTNRVDFAAVPALLHTNTGGTLTLSTSLTGSGGLTKALAGGLTFSSGSRSYITGAHTLLNGTTTLGGVDTFFPNQATVVSLGATLDLNGSAQYVGALTSAGILPGTGGTVTNGTLVTNANGTFGGTITGATTNLAKVGGNGLVLESAQPYSGVTLLMGGTTTLENDATLLNTSSIELNNAGLTLGNNSSLQYQMNDRIGNGIPINLRGGTLTVNGRVSSNATESLGAIDAAQGSNTISANPGGGTFNTIELTIASLTRGAGATVNFTGSALGQQGNAGRIFFTTPLSTVAGGALGAWAIANTTDYAAYNTGTGIGVVGQGGFAGYDTAFASGNITELPGMLYSTANTTLATGTTTTGLLRIGGNNFNNISFTTGSDTLVLENGGILRSNVNFGSSIGTPTTRGVLTAGTTASPVELHVYNNGAANPTFTNPNTAGTINSGSAVVVMNSTVGLSPGMTVTNANFPAGTKVLSIDSATQMTLSNNATANAQNQTFTAGTMDIAAGGPNMITLNSPTVNVSSTVGLQPGMTITGTGIPVGSFIVSVDSPTQVTMSQNSTATTASLAVTVGLSNVVINSVIANNGSGGPLTLVKSAAGVLALSAANTYTGGTIVNTGGILNLVSPGSAGLASNVVIPAGGITLNNGTMTMLTNRGQIEATNALTLRGGSAFTAVGNNTLDSIAFDNNGGTGTPTVTSGGILTLSNATPITVSSSNPATVATIAGNIAIGTGAKTIDVPAIQVAGNTVTNIVPTLNISAAILSPGVALTKTGAGLLQLGGQSTFTGGLALSNGSILISGNSTPTIGGNGLTSGPLGTGAVSAAAGTSFLVDGSRTIANDITWAGTPTFDATANTSWTLTLNGNLSGLSSGAATVNVNNPGLTVALLGTIPNIGSITSFNKVGPGALIFNSTGYTGNYDAAALGNGLAVQLLHDGNSPNIGNGVVETINLGSVTFDPVGVPTITVGRAGGSLPMNLAVNKILAPSSISSLAGGITVTNNNGYGLAVADAVTFAGLPAITVATATASNFTQGLYLNGVLGGIGFVKTGAGTAVLGNSSNSFTGNVNINQGVISVASNTQLGNAGNQVLLNPQTGTATFRATDTFATSRVFQLSNTANARAIEVVSGKTLTLNTAFDLNAGAGASASLLKADRGTLVLGASNSGWSGALTISGGAVRTSTAANLGTGAITINNPGAALQLDGGITVANPITVDIPGQNLILTGLHTGGAIQSVSGINVISTAITVNNATSNTDNQARSFGFGADSGATLTLGAINVNVATGGTNRSTISYFGGAGTVNLNGIYDNTNASPGANLFLFKYGNGALNINVANALPDAEVRIYRGTANLAGLGTLGTGANNQFQVWQNGTLNVDNSGTNTANRFSNRPIQIGGGTINFTPNSAGSSHVSTAAGTLTVSQGASVLNMNSGGNQTVTFGPLTQNGGATVDVTGTFGTANNKITFTTAPTLSPATTGILARFTTTAMSLPPTARTESAPSADTLLLPTSSAPRPHRPSKLCPRPQTPSPETRR